MNYINRLFGKDAGGPDLLARQSGIYADFLAHFIANNDRLSSCFPVACRLGIDPLWADPGINWSDRLPTPA